MKDPYTKIVSQVAVSDNEESAELYEKEAYRKDMGCPAVENAKERICEKSENYTSGIMTSVKKCAMLQ